EIDALTREIVDAAERRDADPFGAHRAALAERVHVRARAVADARVVRVLDRADRHSAGAAHSGRAPAVRLGRGGEAGARRRVPHRAARDDAGRGRARLHGAPSSSASVRSAMRGTTTSAPAAARSAAGYECATAATRSPARLPA